MTERLNNGLGLKVSPATARLNDAVGCLLREKDGEMFRLQRSSLAYRDKYMQLENVHFKLQQEHEGLIEQATRKEGEVFRIMVSFFVLGAVAACLVWYGTIIFTAN